MIVVVKYLFLGMFVALMSLLAFAHEGERGNKMTGKKRSRKRDKRRRRKKKQEKAQVKNDARD